MSKEEKDIIDDLKQGAENGSLFSSLWGMLSKRAKYVLFATIGLPVGGGVGGGAYLYNSGADLLVNITKPAFERAGFVIIPDSLSFPKKVEHNVYVAAIKRSNHLSARIDTLEWKDTYQQGVNHYFLTSTCDTTTVNNKLVYSNCYGDRVIEHEFKGRKLIYVLDSYGGKYYIEPFQWQLNKGESNNVEVK